MLGNISVVSPIILKSNGAISVLITGDIRGGFRNKESLKNFFELSLLITSAIVGLLIIEILMRSGLLSSAI
jgi:hypothetical protein